MTDATELDEAAIRMRSEACLRGFEAEVPAHWYGQADVVARALRKEYGPGGIYDADAAFIVACSPSVVLAALDEITQLRAALDEARSTHRDLVFRLGFGDNITEPMADNDTVVAWFEQQSRDANEWQESQLWRNDCYVAGHPDDEDCWEHDPTLRLQAAESALAAIEELAKVQAISCRAQHRADHERNWLDVLALIERAALATPTTTDEGDDRG